MLVRGSVTAGAGRIKMVALGACTGLQHTPHRSALCVTSWRKRSSELPLTQRWAQPDALGQSPARGRPGTELGSVGGGGKPAPCPKSFVSLAAGHPGPRLPCPSLGERQQELSVTSQRTPSGAPVPAGDPRWVACQPRGYLALRGPASKPSGRNCSNTRISRTTQGLYLRSANQP